MLGFQGKSGERRRWPRPATVKSLENGREPLRKEHVGNVGARRRYNHDQQQFDPAVSGQTRLGGNGRISTSAHRETQAMKEPGDAFEEQFEQNQSDEQSSADSGIGQSGAAGGPLHCIR